MTSAATASHGGGNGESSHPPEGTSETLRVLAPDGQLLPGAGALDDERALALHEAIIRGRLAEARAARWADEGRIGMCLRARGGGDAYVAAAFALRERDWLFGEGREHGAALLRGLGLRRWADQLFGNAHDLGKGRQTPGSWSSREARLASVSAPLGTHLIHAVGFAWAAHIRRDPLVALATFDEAAVASSDFHNALNFAGVFRIPAVFVCLGDGGALDRAELDIGAAYGVPQVRCDASDPLAVLLATREAIERADAGYGPTLVEATVEPGEVSARLTRHLEARSKWSAEQQSVLEGRLGRELDEAAEAAERAPAPAPTTIVDDVFAEPPPHLVAQRRELERSR